MMVFSVGRKGAGLLFANRKPYDFDFPLSRPYRMRMTFDFLAE